MVKRLISTIISIVMLISFIPALPIQAAAAATTIKIGDYVQMGKYYDEPILWRCVDIDENGPLILADRILTIKAFDAAGNHKYLDGTAQADDSRNYRTKYGSNLWETSNLRSWLNSTATSGNVIWLDGCPPTVDKMTNGFGDYTHPNNAYDNEKGFLAEGNFTASEQNIIKSVTQKSLLSGIDIKLIEGGTSEYISNGSIASLVPNYETAYFDNVTDKMFLLDVKQLSNVSLNISTLGADYLVGKLTQKAADNSVSSSFWGWADGVNGSSWTRSPRITSNPNDYPNGFEVLYVGSNIFQCNGAGLGSNLSDFLGVRPAFYLNMSSVIFKSGDGSVGMPYVIDSLVVKSDLTAYNKALSAVIKSTYTPESWTKYQEVVSANVVTALNTQMEVTIATLRINTAQIIYLFKTKENKDLEDFNYNPNVFSKELAIRAAEFSMLAYDDYVWNEKDDSYTSIDIRGGGPYYLRSKLEKQQRFINVQAFNYNDGIDNNVSFVIANKDVFYLGEKRKLTTVIIRGTDGNEWQGDMDVTGASYDGSLTIHKSFDDAKVDVLAKLKTYLEQHSITNTLLLVTGHSRGAAVANLLAEDIDETIEKKSDPQCKISEVFAYTFATPNSTTKANKDRSNIFNFCFEDDFVPNVPLKDGWGYDKNGKTFTTVAQILCSTNSSFFSDMKKYVGSSGDQIFKNPDFNYQGTKNLIKYVNGIWTNTEKFYNKTKYPGVIYTDEGTIPITRTDITLYDFFRNYVAPAAMKVDSGATKADVGKLLSKGLSPTYGAIADFFISGGGVKGCLPDYINDTHQMFTYYAALKDGGFDESIYSKSSLKSLMSLANLNTTTNSPTNFNVSEVEKIKIFLKQGDNLRNLGWSLDDVSTWSGVLWSGDTENKIASIDISYKDLIGTLDLSGFSNLNKLDLSGNLLTEIDLSNCTSLVDTDCSNNGLTKLLVSNSKTLTSLDCSWNDIVELNVEGCTSLIKLYCNNNKLTTLNVNTNFQLTDLYCAGNDLTTIDIASNALLNSFSCEKNYFDIQSGSVMLNTVQTVEARTNSLVRYEPQNMPENPIFNAEDVAKLIAFANQSNNTTKLQWDLSKPKDWYGVEWVKVGNEYRTNRITLDNLDLTGNLDLANMPYLEFLSCNDNQFMDVNVSSCTTLRYLSCYNSSIKTLNIINCPIITILECEKNYLDISEGSVLMSSIGAILLKDQSRVNYFVQKISASQDMFNANEYNKLVDFAKISGNFSILNWDINKPGEWTGVVWELIEGQYRVKEISFNYKEVTGKLDVSSFDKLTKLDCKTTKITSISLPLSITTIDSSMFYDCSELMDIEIPQSVTTISEDAFYNCVKLTSVIIPDNTTLIGNNAFRKCENLTSITIPSNVVAMGEGVFYDCKNLSKVIFMGNAPNVFGTNIFNGVKADFKIYHNQDATGFTSSLEGYTCEIIKLPSLITILQSTISMIVGETKQLEVTVEPIDVTDPSITWSVQSQDASNLDTVNVVTVSAEGIITAVNTGTAVIRATSRLDATKYEECMVVTVNIDFNNDGKVDTNDLNALRNSYNGKTGDTNYDSSYDINSDGVIDIFDLVRVSKEIK
jgi:hypothetical protein